MRNTIIALRTKKGLTQTAISELIGVCQPNYCNFEKGTKNFDFAKWKKIQNVLEIPDSEMWGIINE